MPSMRLPGRSRPMNDMRKEGFERPSICYVTTIPATLTAFIVPSADFLRRVGGFNVTLVSSGGESFEKGLPPGVRFEQVEMRRGIDLRGVLAVWRLFRFFRTNEFDIVQFCTPNASLYASIASTLARVPIRIYAQWGIRYVGFSGVKRELFKTIEMLTCRLATHIEPDSRGNLEFSAEEQLYPKQKGFVLWNGSAAGVDLRRFDHSRKRVWGKETRVRYGIPADSFIVGFVGRLCMDKGGNELLKAASSFLDAVPGSHLLLVGPVEGTTMEPDLISWAQHDPRVTLTGPTDHVEQLMAAMDVLALPSYREGFGSVVVEAEAMGIPVVVTDIPGPREAIRPNETGLMVPVRDEKSLLHALVKLQSDSDLRKRLGDAGVEFAHTHFSRDQFQEHLLARRISLLRSTSRWMPAGRGEPPTTTTRPPNFSSSHLSEGQGEK